MSIVINTPNGNIGRNLALHLLAAGKSLTVISRTADKVADLAKRGAKVVEGSIDDAATLDKAFTGAEAIFWLTPPAMRPDFLAWAGDTARKAAAVAKVKGVKRVVVLSSVGAQNGPGTGPVGALLAVEEAFKSAVADVTILRPGFFMENLLRDVGSLAGMSTLFSTQAPDKAVPMVCTADIATKGAEVLLDAGWKGHRYVGIHGPANLSYPQVAAVLSDVLGKPVKFVQVSLADAGKGMVGAGMPQWAVDLYLEMFASIPAGRMDPAEPRTAETTTATTLGAWARQVLKPAVEKAASAAA